MRHGGVAQPSELSGLSAAASPGGARGALPGGRPGPGVRGGRAGDRGVATRPGAPPPESKQHPSLRGRVGELSRRLEEGGSATAAAPAATPDGTARSGWRWAGLGAAGAVAWKLKAVVAFVLTKGKMLLLGLAKSGTSLSMLFAFGVYWAAGLEVRRRPHLSGPDSLDRPLRQDPAAGPDLRAAVSPGGGGPPTAGQRHCRRRLPPRRLTLVARDVVRPRARAPALTHPVPLA